jgi:hypothetical protein
MKVILTVLITIFCFQSLVAQQNYYLFRAGNGTYADLVNDTAITPAKFGTGEMWAFELNGETFNLFGKNYVMDGTTKYVSFSNSGHMRIDDDTSLIILDGLFRFLDSIDGNSRLSYIVDGSGSSKILKVQWKNLGIQGGPAGNFVNFQVWLHKATGIFEIYYGPSSANNASGYTASTGPNVGLFYSRKDFTKMFEKIWITQTPSSYVIDSARNFSFNAMTGVPSSGTVYRFIPKHITTSVDEGMAGIGYSIFPNPADSRVTITTKQQATLQLSGMGGKIVYSGATRSGKAIIDLHALPAGIYLLNITIGSSTYSEKLSITH